MEIQAGTNNPSTIFLFQTKVMKEIETQVKDIDINEVEELTLDSHHFGKFTVELKEKIESYKNLYSLTLNDCQLKSLVNFPNLPNLAKLELIDNQLAASALNDLPNFPELQSLSLGGNRINTIDEISSLKKYTQIVELDFLGCDITKVDNYRSQLFNEFPNLIILDTADKDGNEVELDNDESEIEDIESEEEGYCKRFKKCIFVGQNQEDEEEDDGDDDDGDNEDEEEPQPEKKIKK